MDGEEHRPKSNKRVKRMLIRTIIGFLLLAAIVGCIVLFFKYREAVDTNPKNIEQRTAEQVSRLVEIPNNEKPSVLTVLDASKLTNKELAERAATGDRLLVYSDSQRIIIFRPSNGKIIDMLTIRAATETTTNLTQPAGTAPANQSR